MIRGVLERYPGTILAVSHDRKLMETVFSRRCILDERGLREE